MSDDGRLDLDDLGSVIESASSIDEPLEVLGDDSRVTWGERLESAGITPWVRRHRVALSIATVAALAVGIGATTWVRAQPPPWHDVAISAVPASVDALNGPGLSFADNGIIMAAYLVSADDPTASLRVDGFEGPGIRASTVGAPHPNGNQAAVLVRALIGCGGDLPASVVADYALRVTVTDAWGRSRPEMVAVQSAEAGWPQLVMQTCLQSTVFSDVDLTDLRASVDQGAGAVRLDLDLTSRLPVAAQVQFEGIDTTQLLLPYNDSPVELGIGSTATVSTSLQVRDCSAGTPTLPEVTVPDDPADPRSYSNTDGIGVFVVTPDRQAGAQLPLAFNEQQSAEVRRALAEICRGAPRVAVSDLAVVRTVDDTSLATTTLTLTLRSTVSGGRVMKVAVSPDPAFGAPDQAAIAWTTLPAGGGRGEVTWTFSCQADPQPPTLEVRFVDGLRATPVRVPLDQEVVAPHVSAACPLLTTATLVEQGWTLP